MVTFTEKRFFEWHEDDVSVTLRNRGGSYGGGSEVLAVCIGNGQAHMASHITKEVCQTLNTMHDPMAIMTNAVRRLTPLECERLQGFPGGWTDIREWTDTSGRKRETSDSARYKALGNSIALPFWQFLARRICAQYERDITMGSLFDGIGGFPLVFERCGAKAVWASEIEEFPIAVTKKHFPEDAGNE